MAAAVAGADASAGGPRVGKAIIEARAAADPASMAVVAHRPRGRLGIPIHFVAESNIAVEGEIGVGVEPGYAGVDSLG